MRVSIENPSVVVFLSASLTRLSYAKDGATYERPYGEGIVQSLDTEASYDDADPWFIFYVEDSAYPALHAIQARSFKAAYEAFIDQEAKRGHYVMRREDYESDAEAEAAYENATFSSDGVPVDSECFQGYELDRVIKVIA